jgi:hypothetical protein
VAEIPSTLFWAAAAMVATGMWLPIRERHERPIHTKSWTITIGTGTMRTPSIITTLIRMGKSRSFIWPVILVVTFGLAGGVDR